MRLRCKAFTLIELLVVIAIVAVLVAMIFNVADRGIVKANQTKSLNNMKQVATGFMLYAADNNGRLPNRPVDGSTADRWPKLIHSYLQDTQVFAAMDDPSNFIRRGTDPLSNSSNNTSYIMNGGLDPDRGQAQAEEQPMTLAAIQQPSSTILLGLIYTDTNFFLDVANGDESLIRPNQFGSNNNYVFMDGSARTLDAKDYVDGNRGKAWLWLLNKGEDDR